MKLEDINKKNIYKVPDKYFDQLPTRIQARVGERKPVFNLSITWNIAIKVAVPAFVVVLLLFYFGIDANYNNMSADDILAQVSTEDLVAYLETTDITTEEILDEIDFSTIDIDFYDDQILMEDIEMNEESMDILYDQFGLESEIL